VSIGVAWELVVRECNGAGKVCVGKNALLSMVMAAPYGICMTTGAVVRLSVEDVASAGQIETLISTFISSPTWREATRFFTLNFFTLFARIYIRTDTCTRMLGPLHMYV